MTGTPQVRPMVDADREGWDAFVRGHQHGSLFHLTAWASAVRHGFGHRCPYLLAERAGRITGVLPLVALRGPLFGRSLVSTGFGVGGGVLAEDEESAQALLAAAEALARDTRAKRLELRAPVPERAGWVAAEGLYFGFRKPLDPDPERNYVGLRRKQRATIRKGLQAGLTSEIDATVDRLHAVYAASVHRLGTPVFPKRYFAALKQAFGDDCEVLTIVHGGAAIASVMSFYFRDEVLPYYGGSLPEGRDLAASDVMYHELMRHAVAVRGVRLFDFGRSKADTGAFAFKRHWGFEPEPLVYSHWLPGGGKPPELNPKFRPFVAAWQRQPLWLSKLVGPWIARELG